jgi:hypothetical protein
MFPKRSKRPKNPRLKDAFKDLHTSKTADLPPNVMNLDETLTETQMITAVIACRVSEKQDARFSMCESHHLAYVVRSVRITSLFC